ncbi:hypothetical protein HanRHA438_Chr06g0273081 [Helianthus annuus]|nr:hypothetical protein HanRHA438_Chr06g0273081 [Helianthus annuus]
MSSKYSYLSIMKYLNRCRIRILICCSSFVGAGKSSKSAFCFSVSDLDAFASSRSGKKQLAASPSIPAPKAVSTKGKGGKKRKTAETLEGLPLIQHQFDEYVSEKFAEIHMLMDSYAEEAEQKHLDFQKIFLAKD